MRKVLKLLAVISGSIIMGIFFVSILVIDGDVSPSDESSLVQMARFVYDKPAFLILLVFFTVIGGFAFIGEKEEDRHPTKLGKAFNWFCSKLMGE